MSHTAPFEMLWSNSRDPRRALKILTQIGSRSRKVGRGNDRKCIREKGKNKDRRSPMAGTDMLTVSLNTVVDMVIPDLMFHFLKGFGGEVGLRRK